LEFFLGFFENGHLSEHLLLALVPVLLPDSIVLLLILELIFKLEDGLAEIFDLGGKLLDLQFILVFNIAVLVHRLNFLLLELLDQLLLFLVLLLRLLRQVLDLLHIEGLLLVVFRLRGLLHPSDFFLLLERLVHPVSHFLLFADHVLAKLVDLRVSVELDSFTFLECLRKTFSGHFLACCQLSFLLLNVPQLRVKYFIDFAFFIFQFGQVLLHFQVSLLSQLRL